MGTDTKAVLEQAAAWIESGARVAVATVVQTWSSAPQPVGSQMVIDESGRFAGSVSGGCVEGAIICASAEVLASGDPQLVSFGVTNNQAWDVGLPCGGKIEVLVHEADRSVISRLVRCHRDRQAVVVIADVSSGASTAVGPGELETFEASARLAIEEALSTGVSRVITLDDPPRVVSVVQPPARLIIVGAVHLAQALAAIARVAELDVTVIDPRRLFATAERFPDVALITGWPGDALAELKLDGRTALAALSHDPKVDIPALRAALLSDCFFVGALGSRRRQAELRASLRESGVPDADLERLAGPIGLDIGARSAPEIAVAILAQVISLLRRGGDHRFGSR